MPNTLKTSNIYEMSDYSAEPNLKKKKNDKNGQQIMTEKN